MSLAKISILLGIIFWPISLFLNNTLPGFFNYFFPAVFSKLALFPILLVVSYSVLSKKFNTKILLLLILSFFVLLIGFKNLQGQSIFRKDYEAEQSVIRQTLLYPNVFLARTFHNKARIYIDKFNSNFFALTDPNNYFFRFSPRQITVDNQNLKKFPALAIFPVLLGFYFLYKHKNKKLILAWLVTAIISLSILKVFDRNDFILWIPLSLIFIHGMNEVNKLKKRKYPKIFFVIFIIFSIFELWQILVS